jgi:hypothetical protein
VFSGSFTTALTAFFKTRYPQRKVEDLVTWDNPTLNALGRSDELTGIQTIIPLQLDLPQGMSVDLRTAIDNDSPIYGKSWTITPSSYYVGARFDAKTLMAAKNDQGAFFRMKERDIASRLKMLGLEWEKHLWSAGTASLGTLTSDPGTNTYFEVSHGDAIAFHVNQKVRFYADSSGSPGTERAGGTRTISGINYMQSSTVARITVSAAMDTAVGSGDHVCRDGDVNATIKGIPAWIPSSDPTDTFFGLARTNHPQMTGGWRVGYQGSIEESAKKLVEKLNRFNLNPKTLWLSYANWNRLEIELGARGIRTEDGGKGTFGRSSLGMSTPSGPITVKAGPFVPETAGYLLDMSTWKLMTLGAAPHLVEDDGLSARVVGVASRDGSLAEDAVEMRWRAFLQLVCLNPFVNGRFTIS